MPQVSWSVAIAWLVIPSAVAGYEAAVLMWRFGGAS